MSSKVSNPQSDPNYVSPEECQELFGSFLEGPPPQNIPEWQVELLRERMARYCETGFQGTPFEEYEKKVLERLKELKRLMKS